MKLLVRTTFSKIKPWLCEPPAKLERDSLHLCTTGAKAYYIGGGWWKLLPYTYGWEDVKRIYQSL